MNLNEPIAVIVAAALTVGATLLGASLGATRYYYRQRWWDARMQAYNNILASLTEMEYLLSEWMREMEYSRQTSDAQSAQMNARFATALENIHRASNAGLLMVSPEVANHLKFAVIKLRAQKADASVYSLMDEDASVIQHTIRQVASCAAKELKLPGKRA